MIYGAESSLTVAGTINGSTLSRIKINFNELSNKKQQETNQSI
jgi:hypothetical protein